MLLISPFRAKTQQGQGIFILQSHRNLSGIKNTMFKIPPEKVEEKEENKD